ncbi:MAG: hypothetical protein ACYSWO_30385, partial [Planctomycetota bacterium]
MATLQRYLIGTVVAVAGALAGAASGKTLVVGVAQTVVENTLDRNLAKIVRFIDEANSRGCRLVIFPENALYQADISVDDAKTADID